MIGSLVDCYKIYVAARLPYERGYTKAQERDYVCYIKDSCISRTKKGEIVGGKSTNGNII
jgi:hypothetical protein